MRFKKSRYECLAPYPANNRTSAADCLGSTTGKQTLIFYESIVKGGDNHFSGMYPYAVSPTGSKCKYPN